MRLSDAMTEPVVGETVRVESVFPTDCTGAPLEVMKFASLLNQESLTDEEAMEVSNPAEPMYEKPWESDG